MVVIHDIRSRTPRSNGTRKLSSIRNIARHHSATTDGNFDTFWKTWHGVKGWNTGGYHEIILRDGSVQLCYNPEEITNGVGGHNSYVYHICVVGNGSFTAKQEATFKERCLLAMRRFNLPVSAVKGHNEFSGTNTACPGINMNTVRQALKTGVLPVSADVKRDYFLNGDTDAKIKSLQKDLNFIGYTPKLAEDGIFGDGTEKAVVWLQKKAKIDPDGVAGKDTLKALAEAVAETQNAAKPATKPKPAAKPTEKEVDDLPKELIVINTENDYLAARKLSIRRNIPVIERAGVKGKVAEKVYIVGGGKAGLEKAAASFVDLSGDSWETTVKAVDEYLKK